MTKLRDPKGAITMITLITVLFLVSFLMSTYIIISNKVKTQKEILNETKSIYEPKVNMEEIYNSYFSNDSIIPIYTVNQLLSIGNNKKINIDGKIYTFSNDKVYLLKNNLEFSVETDLIPIYNSENIEWNGHTIKITTLNGNVTYSEDTIIGYPITLADTKESILADYDYRIYGNSIQDGTPSTINPVEIQSVGDYTIDTMTGNGEYGKYIIPVKVSGENGNEQTFNIILDEPLRKIGDYEDYIDFANQQIVRNVEVLDNTGTLTIQESYKGLETSIIESIELPQIQLYKGVNTITVGTDVQPSNMSITYNVKQ